MPYCSTENRKCKRFSDKEAKTDRIVKCVIFSLIYFVKNSKLNNL